MSTETVKLIISIAYVVVSVLSLLITFFCFKKKLRNANDDNTLSDAIRYIHEQLPNYITIAESVLGSGNGKNKLELVLFYVQKLCDSFGITFDKRYFTQEIENILATPAKKSVCVEEQEKA